MGPLKTFTPEVYSYDCMTVLEYPRRYELMYALARFQEFYENPELKKTIFSRDHLQFLQPDYYVNWNGCNFPPHVVEAFHDPLWLVQLDRHEELALSLMPQGRYIVGCHTEIIEKPEEWVLDERRRAVLRHEYAHALYATNAYYRSCIGETVPEGCEEAVAALRALGYDDEVIVDELQAYTFSGWERLKLHPGIQPPLEFMVVQGHIAEMHAASRKDWAPWKTASGQKQ